MTEIDSSFRGVDQARGLRSEAVFSAQKSRFWGSSNAPGDSLTEIGIAEEVKHSRYVVFQMTGLTVPRNLFGAILARIGWLRASPKLVSVT